MDSFDGKDQQRVRFGNEFNDHTLLVLLEMWANECKYNEDTPLSKYEHHIYKCENLLKSLLQQCPTCCHCCCGNRQRPPQISSNQAGSDEHFQLNYSEVYPEGYQQGVDRYGQHISQRPCSLTGDNCQHLVYTKPAKTNHAFGDCIGPGKYDGHSGPTTLTASSRRPELASDGVRLLHYSGS